MSPAYGVIAITALVQLGICIVVDRGKEIWLLFLFISVFVANLGYFLLSVSRTLDFALMSNRIAYSGTVFLPFFMFMIILNLCGVQYRNRLPAVLGIASLTVLAIAASPGYLTVYYRTVSLEIVDGASRLVREYGFLHGLYYIYLFLYFGAMLLVIVYSLVGKRITNRIHGILLLFIVFIDIAVWLIEQFLPRGFEFLSVAYIVSESLIFALYALFRKYNMKRRVICVWTLVFSSIGIAMACRFAPTETSGYYFFSLVRSFIYMGMYYAWGRIVCHGIIQRTSRRCLGGVSALLVFWVALSTCKHLIFKDNVTIVRYLWYSYYIPQILIAVLSLNIAVMAGKGENARLGKGGMALLGAGMALILLVMTNDLHQIVFSFPEGVPWTNAVCTHEVWYYLIMALIAVCGIAALSLIAYKCRIPGRKKFTVLPFMVVLFMVIYGVLYFVDGSIVRRYLNDMTASGCLMIMVLFELVIESGLFQTNNGYDDLFESATLAVQITDNDHHVRYTSECARMVPEEILAQADTAPVMLEQSVRLSGAAIHGGYIYWQEDMAELLSVQRELEITLEELCDTGDLLKAAAEQKAYRLHLEEKNRLYELVEAQTAPQVAMLRELTIRLGQADNLEDAKRLLGQIVVIGTYIKRRSNLIFVAGQEPDICMEELRLCMKESMENLKLYGVVCGVYVSGSERLMTQTACTVYDLFEAVVEMGLDTISSILLRLEMEPGGLFLTICADCTEDLTKLHAFFPEITVSQDEDGVWYLNRGFGQGGVHP